MKKLFISADIEGTCGITSWSETERSSPDSAYFIEQMTREVVSVCKGAEKAGYDKIIVRDAHDSARNILPDRLPVSTELIRGWGPDPLCMVSGLDSSYDAAIFTGYHSAAGSGGSPLCHTLTTSVSQIIINGRRADEFMINAYSAAYLGVPVVMVTGDDLLCSSAEELVPEIISVPVLSGVGGYTRSLNPYLACGLIENSAEKALRQIVSLIALPDIFDIGVTYKNHADAYKASFYPGASLIEPNTVKYSDNNYYNILLFIHFCV